MNKWHYAILGVAGTCFFLWLLGVSLMFKSYSVCGLDKFFTAMTLYDVGNRNVHGGA